MEMTLFLILAGVPSTVYSRIQVNVKCLFCVLYLFIIYLFIYYKHLLHGVVDLHNLIG